MSIHHFQSPDARPPVRSRIPDFESTAVEHTKAKITSVARLDIDDQVFRMDDAVKVVVECRVEGIDHKVNADGDLERVHLLKALDAVVVSWDMDLDGLKKALES
jgi:hypothetical protein